MLPKKEIVALAASSLILNSVPSQSSLMILALKGDEKERAANKVINNFRIKKEGLTPLILISCQPLKMRNPPRSWFSRRDF